MPFTHSPQSHRRRVRLLAMLAAGFAALAIMGATSIWLVQKSKSDSAWVVHSLDVENQISLLQLSIRRAEAGQRGYMLTSDPAYLDIYKTSADQIPRRMAELRNTLDDNGDQLARLDELQKLVGAKQASLESISEFLRRGQASDALTLMRDPDDLARMADFTRLTSEMRAAEAALLGARMEQTGATNSWLLATTLVSAAAIVMLAILALLLIRRSHLEILQAQRALAETNASLEEKVAERTAGLQEANDELQRFAYIVSHDLRSPLVNIMGFTGELETIRADWLERETARQAAGQPMDPARKASLDDFEEALGFIKSSIAKMDRLINSILEISRVGRRDYRPETLDLNAILTSLRDALAHQAQEADATIEIEPLPEIESDRIAVEQIFSNLLDNAIKYLVRGRPGEIRVKAGERGNFALIRVSDNGRGIDGADQERVFDLFRRAGPQDRPGDGIGLAHARTLVRRIGGSIRLESEPDKGSTFTVILPKRWRLP